LQEASYLLSLHNNPQKIDDHVLQLLSRREVHTPIANETSPISFTSNVTPVASDSIAQSQLPVDDDVTVPGPNKFFPKLTPNPETKTTGMDELDATSTDSSESFKLKKKKKKKDKEDETPGSTAMVMIFNDLPLQ